MELPVDEEDNEEVVGVPEHLEAGAAALLHRVPDHHKEGGGHDPTRDTGARRKVRGEEGDEALGGGRRVGVREGEFRKVEHVGDDVDDSAEDNGPRGRLVESNVLIEGDVVVERGAADKRDEVAADGQQDEDDIDVQDERGRTRNYYESRVRVRMASMYGRR